MGHAAEEDNRKEFEPSHESLEQVLNSKVLVTISFHYTESRLEYLSEVLIHLSTLPNADIVVITNTFKDSELNSIQQVFDSVLSDCLEINALTMSYPNLDNPFDLTWCHKEIITQVFLAAQSIYTHFIYLEDDITFNFNNFCYFVEFRDELRSKGLLPSFLRVEQKKEEMDFFNTDHLSPINIDKRSLVVSSNFLLVNIPTPYMACYVLDVELAREYVKSKSFDKELSRFCSWEVRERAAMGLCFENIPASFDSRYVVPVSESTLQAPGCAWVYHLPNNYADNPHTPFGKVPMNSLFFRPPLNL